MSTSAIHEDGMGNLKPPVQPGKQLALSTKDEEIANEAPCLAEPAQTPTQLQFLPAEFLTTAIRLHEIRMTTFVKTKRPCDFQMISGCLAHHIPFNRLDRNFRLIPCHGLPRIPTPHAPTIRSGFRRGVRRTNRSEAKAVRAG